MLVMIESIILILAEFRFPIGLLVKFIINPLEIWYLIDNMNGLLECNIFELL